MNRQVDFECVVQAEEPLWIPQQDEWDPMLEMEGHDEWLDRQIERQDHHKDSLYW